MDCESRKRRGRITAETRWLILLLSFAVLYVAGCNRQGDTVQHFQLKGQIVALDPSSKHITISHEDIPGHMKAMTMSFQVRDTSLLRGIEVGDSVRGVLAVRHPEMWLDSLTVVAKTSESEKMHQ